MRKKTENLDIIVDKNQIKDQEVFDKAYQYIEMYY